MGLAIAAALKGYRCIFTMPDKMSQEKVRLLKAFGAEVVITPTAVPPDHPENYVMKAKQIVQDTPGAILANQFYNQENPKRTIAPPAPRSGSRPPAASPISWRVPGPVAPSAAPASS